MLRINHYNSLFCVRNMLKSYMKHYFILWSHTLLTCFVFSWVVEVSAAYFIDCLACMPWQQRGLDAGSSLASSFTVLSLCIDDSVTLTVLICITAYAQCFSIFCCFPAQCCSTAAHYIAMTCKHTFFTFTLLNSEKFQYINLSYLYS